MLLPAAFIAIILRLMLMIFAKKSYPAIMADQCGLMEMSSYFP